MTDDIRKWAEVLEGFARRHPEEAEVLRAATLHRLGVAGRDQMNAGVRDAETVFYGLAGALESVTGGRSVVTDDPVPRAVRLTILETSVAWVLGKARRCRHLPRPGPVGPPVMFAAWRPRVVSCLVCSRYLFAIPRRSPVDLTCDGCGEYTETVRPAHAQYDRVVVLMGLCASCQPEEPS